MVGYGWERSRFGYLFDSSGRNIGQGIDHCVRVGFFLRVEHGRATFVESDKQGSCLGEFVFEYIEIGFDAFESIVIYFRGLVVHGHQILIIFANIFGLVLISSFEGQFLQQLPQSNTIGIIFAGEYIIKGLVISHIATRKGFFHLLQHQLFCFLITHFKLLQLGYYILFQLLDCFCYRGQHLPQLVTEALDLGVHDIVIHLSAALLVHQVVVDVRLFGQTSHREAHLLLVHHLGDIDDVCVDVVTAVLFFEQAGRTS